VPGVVSAPSKEGIVVLRIHARWSLFVPLSIALACGGAIEEQQEQVHEKDLAETEAEVHAAGWTIEQRTIASAHPLADDLRQEIEVEAPDTTRKFRIRFRRVDLESGYDFLIVQDEWGQELERITGRHKNYVTRSISGKKAKLVLQTDEAVRSWGFEVDQLRHRGCAHNPPSSPALMSLGNCTALRESIRDLAIQEIRRRFTDGHFGGPIIALRGAAEAQPSAAPAHSETNTQVRGVDEPDIVKTDGNLTYAVSGHQVRVYRTWPAADTALVQSLDVEGWPRELFLDNGRLVVLSGVQGEGFSPPACRGLVCPMYLMPIWWRPDAFTKVTVFDVRSGTARVVSETLLAGQYENARRMGSALRLVVRRELRWPNIQYYPEGVEWNSPEFDRRMDELEADAIRIVRDRELADWLPQSYRVVNGRRVPMPIDCSNYLLPRSTQEMGLTSVVTMNLTNATEPSVQDTSLMASSSLIYQSAENLYLTGNHSWSCWEDYDKEGQFTYVHKLDVSRPEQTTYAASGVVPGNVSNQFWLDEHAGYLRVASMNTRWNAERPEDRTTNKVYVLGQTRSRLDVVGETPAMAPGEQIFGARFMGDRGFIVTFRQVDPLFTLDLSNPRSPTIRGELKIPGFSTYLHPLDQNYLFAIGNDFEEDGRTRNGVALTIFDVRNLAAPRMVHKSVVGSTNGYSEALYDHKAFTMYRQPGSSDVLLAIPFTDWIQNEDPNSYWNSFQSTLKVFRVSSRGILGLGEISHSDFFRDNASNEWGWWYQPQVRRGVFVEDFAYAISDAGVRVANVASLGTPVASVKAMPQFEDPRPVDPIVTLDVSATPNLAIPDANTTGITSEVTFAEDLEITSLNVDLEIRHTYRGDLVVTIEHDGTTETLHDKIGGSQDDLVRTFITERFRGKNARGTWRLRVADTARADVGRLVTWKVTASGKSSAGTASTVERTYSMDRSVAIPDNDTRGISSEIQVPEGTRIDQLRVVVDITHTYRGDLRVVLEHDGVERVLHNVTGGSLDDLKLDVSTDEWKGRDARGTWTLRVIDNGRSDLGTLNRWSLELKGTAL
jgi:subtilisin-like proprotein convertase family protein